MLDINPVQAKWARESAGLTLAEAAKKLEVGDSKDISAADKLSEMETGQRAVTEAMLYKMERVYRWPLITFYLKKRPSTDSTTIDFRTMNSKSKFTQTPLVNSLISNILGRHGLIASVLEDEETITLGFVGLFSGSTKEKALIPFLRESLLDGKTLLPHKTKNDFNRLRERIENLGIFVLLQGDLGSYHTDIDPTEFRGFAISDPIAPVIVLNDNEKGNPRTFTLIHELVHILLGDTGLSGDIGGSGTEQFCNDVASEFLVPEQELADFRAEFFPDASDLTTFIDAAKKHFCASADLILYRTYRANVISSKEYRALRSTIYGNVISEENKHHHSHGPHPDVVKKYKLGSPLLDLVKRALTRGSLSSTKAAYVLGVKHSRLTAMVGR